MRNNDDYCLLDRPWEPSFSSLPGADGSKDLLCHVGQRRRRAHIYKRHKRSHIGYQHGAVFHGIELRLCRTAHVHIDGHHYNRDRHGNVSVLILQNVAGTTSGRTLYRHYNSMRRICSCNSFPWASIMAVGAIALPEMARYKYDKKMALGSIAAGSELGDLIPPSSMFIVYGMMTGTSHRNTSHIRNHAGDY